MSSPGDAASSPAAAPAATPAQPQQVQRLKPDEQSSGGGGGGGGGRSRTRTDSDSRWRTTSFSEPARVIVIAVDSSDNSKNAFDCECLQYFSCMTWFGFGLKFIITFKNPLKHVYVFGVTLVVRNSAQKSSMSTRGI